jgi:hypothetical protein
MRNVKVTTVVTPSLVTQKVIKHFSLPRHTTTPRDAFRVNKHSQISTESHPKTRSFYSKVHMYYSTPGKRWN